MSNFSLDSLVNRTLEESPSVESRPSFWENYEESEVLSTNHKGMSTYKVRIPDSEDFVVVKPKDIRSPNGNHPRKTAIFQEIARHYGVQTVKEVTIERDGKAIRIAEYIPAIDFASAINGNREENLTAEEREAVEQWFPEGIFEDYTLIRRHSQGSTYYTAQINKVTLDAEKFREWYEADNDTESKAKASLHAIHDMISDGFLMDIFGELNLAFHDGEFILVDVEPLQLSNVAYLKPATVNHSEAKLNRMFAKVGLPVISYAEIVKRNYGEDKFLETRSEFNPQVSTGYLEILHTNVTNEDELKLYEQRLEERKNG